MKSQDYLRYQKNPSHLFDQTELSPIREDTHWIIIDEVQIVLKLIDEVHRIHEEPGLGTRVHFALTGSSARKLKRGGANLLAGRALVNNLYPLTHIELGKDFNLTSALNWGSPTIDRDRKRRACKS